MSIDFFVDTLERPEPTPDLTRELGIRHEETIDKRNIYGVREYGMIYYWPEKMSFGHGIYIEIDLLQGLRLKLDSYDYKTLIAAKKRGLEIPERFIELIRKDKGILANPICYKYLQDFPDLAKVSDLETEWGILKHTQGKPCYNVYLRTGYRAPLEDITKMCEIAETFAQRFNGIAWGEGQIGSLDPAEVYRLYCRL